MKELTIEQEFNMLEEWFYWWCEDYVRSIKINNPFDTMRRLKEQGIIYISTYSRIMTFEEFKKTFL